MCDSFSAMVSGLLGGFSHRTTTRGRRVFGSILFVRSGVLYTYFMFNERGRVGHEVSVDGGRTIA